MYVDAVHDVKNDRIHVVERTPEGKRTYKEYPTNYTLYYADHKGKYRSIFGDPLSRFSTRKRAEFEKERRIHSNKKLFESDVNTLFRCLSDNYLNVDPPKLHTCFFDIEVDFDPERGFSPTDDPFNPVTAITCYLDWLDQLVTLVMPPKHMTDETAQELTKDFTNCILYRDEREMFKTFFDLIERAGCLPDHQRGCVPRLGAPDHHTAPALRRPSGRAHQQRRRRPRAGHGRPGQGR